MKLFHEAWTTRRRLRPLLVRPRSRALLERLRLARVEYRAHPIFAKAITAVKIFADRIEANTITGGPFPPPGAPDTGMMMAMRRAAERERYRA